MKKLILISTLLLAVTTLSACSSSSNQNGAAKSNSSVAASSSNSSRSSITNSIDKSKDSSDDVVVTDISSWQHPTKQIFDNDSIKIDKVELKENKTYPIFHVEFNKNLDSENRNYYLSLIKNVAAANSFWSYEIKDDNKDIDIKVNCENNKKLSSIEYNKDVNYFSSAVAESSSNNGDEYVEYLENNVSEVGSFVKTLSNKKDVKPLVYVESYPDPSAADTYKKDYYIIYVGEGHSDHSVNTYRFAINKDTKQILYFDTVKNAYITLEEWRNSRK